MSNSKRITVTTRRESASRAAVVRTVRDREARDARRAIRRGTWDVLETSDRTARRRARGIVETLAEVAR